MPKNVERIIGTLLQSERRSDHDKGLLMMYELMAGKLKSFFSKMSVLDKDQEDLIQDTIIMVYKKMRHPDFQLSSSLTTFAFGVARNIGLMNLRHKSRRGQMEEVKEERIEDFDIIEYLTQVEEYRNLHHVINQLSPDCQQILTWYYFEELSMKEIAKRMNYASAQVAKNRKSSCLKKLRSLMKQLK